MRRFFVVLALIGTTNLNAVAQESCTPVSVADLFLAVNALDDMIAAARVDEARQLANGIHNRMPCVTGLVSSQILGTYARQRAQLAFWEQDEIVMYQWGALGLTVHEVIWHTDMPKDHPFRDVYSDIPIPRTNRLRDRSIQPPKGGAVFMDGVLLTVPSALVETPHFVQLADKRGDVLSSHWQDGIVFPEEILGPEGKAPEAPRWYDPAVASGVPIATDTGTSSPHTESSATRPRARVPILPLVLLSSGGALLVGGTTMGSVSWATAQDYQTSSHTPDDAASLVRTNLAGWSLAAAGTGIVVAGLATWFMGQNTSVAVVAGPTSLTIQGRF